MEKQLSGAASDLTFDHEMWVFRLQTTQSDHNAISKFHR